MHTRGFYSLHATFLELIPSYYSSILDKPENVLGVSREILTEGKPYI